jgi:uncharacterized membrane protein/secreted protein with Ig-like and vWFA domain
MFFENFPIGFARPAWLLALLAIPWMLRLERRGFILMSRRRARWVRTLRVVIIASLILALAGLQISRVSDELTVIFLLDRSDSAREQFDEKLRDLEVALESMDATRDKAGLVVFGADAYVETAPELKPQFEAIETAAETKGTDIARAIRLGLGLFPDDTQRRLTLITDGNENLGDALEEAKTAAASSVPIDVIPIDRDVDEEVLVESVQMPEAIDKDEPFEIKVTIRATDNGTATLRLFRDQEPIGKREVELKPGKNVFTLPDVGDREGFRTYEAMIESLYDTLGENNKGVSYIRVHGKPQILLVGPDKDLEYLQRALSGENWDIATDSQLPAQKIEAERYDAIILANTPSEEFSNNQLNLVRDYVRDLAGGFMMVGGENSFGVGGYAKTGVEEALPVNMELKNKRYFPSLSLAIVMDKSGSMGELVAGGVSKMDLANTAAAEALNLLNDDDLGLVIAFDGSPKRVWGLDRIGGNRGYIESQIKAVKPGGGTDMYPGMVAAYEALRGARSQLKHMILLSDGMTNPANFTELARSCFHEKITVSAVAIGAGADQQLMQTIASLGGGRAYFADDPRRVPRIFAKETYIAQKAYLIEEDFIPAVFQENQIIKGLKGFPTVKGYVVTEPKDRAEVVLLTHKEEPLLASWRFGLGKSVAFMSDAKARWLTHWIGWEGFNQFWIQCIRWVLRNQEQSELHPRIEIDRGKGKIIVDAVDDKDEFINFLDLKARISLPQKEKSRGGGGGASEDGESHDDTALRQVAPGRYEGEFDASEPGAYLARIHGAEDEGIAQATTGFAISYAAEYKDFSTNELLLRQLAERSGGRYNPSLAELFQRDQRDVKSRRDLWFWFLLAAILLFPLDVASRRVFLDQEQIAAIKAFFARFVPSFRLTGDSGDGSLATIEALKKTRGRGRRGQKGAEAETPAAAPIRPTSMTAPETPLAASEGAGESEAIARARTEGASVAESVAPAAAPKPAAPDTAEATLGRLKQAARQAPKPAPSERPAGDKPLIIPSVRSAGPEASSASAEESAEDKGLSPTERLFARPQSRRASANNDERQACLGGIPPFGKSLE